MKNNILKAIISACLKTCFLAFSVIFCLDIFLQLNFDTEILYPSPLWSIVPYVLVFFCIVCLVSYFVRQTEVNKNLKELANTLIKLFCDLAWISPCIVFSAIAQKTHIAVFYVGLALSILLLFLTYVLRYLKFVGKKSEI